MIIEDRVLDTIEGKAKITVGALPAAAEPAKGDPAKEDTGKAEAASNP
jgi:hypothetical protein